MTERFYSGWDPQSEDWAFLDSLPEGIGFADPEPKPRALKPVKEWMLIHRQSRNDCQGHSLTTVCEANHYYATGQIIQLSRHFGYIGSQKLTGDGRCTDQGSHIAAGAKLAVEYGIPLETVYPYPNQFTCHISQQHIEAAKEHKQIELRRLTTPEQIRDFIRSGKGAVSGGVPWGRGYHALAFVDVNEDGTIVEANSHGTSYGTNGFKDRPLSQFSSWFRDRNTVFVGLSQGAGRPVFDWLKNKDWMG